MIDRMEGYYWALLHGCNTWCIVRLVSNKWYKDGTIIDEARLLYIDANRLIRKRAAGYYWIKRNNTWCIGEYDPDIDCWFTKLNECIPSSVFQEIDENKIERV